MKILYTSKQKEIYTNYSLIIKIFTIITNKEIKSNKIK